MGWLDKITPVSRERYLREQKATNSEISALTGKANHVKKLVADIEKNSKVFSDKVEGLKNDVAEVDKKTKVFSDKVEGLENDVAEVDKKTKGLRNDIDEVRQFLGFKGSDDKQGGQSANWCSVMDMANRIDKVEKKTSGIEATLGLHMANTNHLIKKIDDRQDNSDREIGTLKDTCETTSRTLGDHIAKSEILVEATNQQITTTNATLNQHIARSDELMTKRNEEITALKDSSEATNNMLSNHIESSDKLLASNNGRTTVLEEILKEVVQANKLEKKRFEQMDKRINNLRKDDQRKFDQVIESLDQRFNRQRFMQQEQGEY